MGSRSVGPEAARPGDAVRGCVEMLADVVARQGKSDGATSCLCEAFMCDPTEARRDRWLARVPDACRGEAVAMCAHRLLHARKLDPACNLLCGALTLGSCLCTFCLSLVI
ncbi:hypothetical protein [Alicyclobacillus vulcanalis]|uniref:hypothetical protein n=1 Tax=Alicyclobacillus vulcanalis TaxID=252246 RepID=UPI001F32BE02|nr:hypothetical protein [Alicyclobacillus vulcanalis]